MKPSVDPVIEEIHEVRRRIAERFDFDAARISEDARRRQAQEDRPCWQPRTADSEIPVSVEPDNRVAEVETKAE